MNGACMPKTPAAREAGKWVVTSPPPAHPALRLRHPSPAGEYKAALEQERARRLGYVKDGGVKKKDGKEKKEKKERSKKRKRSSKDKKKVRLWVGGGGGGGGDGAVKQRALPGCRQPGQAWVPSKPDVSAGHCFPPQKHKRSSKDKRSKKKKRRHSSDSDSSSSGSSSDSGSSSSLSGKDYGGMGSPVRLSKYLYA